MSVTFGAGITLGAGISVTPGTPVNLRYDTNYIGTGLGTAFNDIGLYDGGPGAYSCLTTEQMSASGKYMVSWVLSFVTDPYNVIGVANRSTNLDSWLGSDINSIGFLQNGEVWYNGSAAASSLPTWGAQGDIIDLVVDNSAERMWIRVNNGDWNGSPTADPVTNQEGVYLPITGQYFAASIGGESGPSELSLQLQPIYSVPAGYTFWGPNPTFTITSSRVSNPNAFDGNFSSVTTNGYVLDSQGDTYSAYRVTITNNDSDIIAAFDAAGEIYNQDYPGYIWIATWGAGSTSYSNIVHAAYNSGNKRFYIIAFDPTSDWEAPGANGFAMAGTFNFPVTLTAYLPPVAKDGWC